MAVHALRQMCEVRFNMVQVLAGDPRLGFRSLYGLKDMSMENLVPFARELLQGTEQWTRLLVPKLWTVDTFKPTDN